jgi:hypothetical protein
VEQDNYLHDRDGGQHHIRAFPDLNRNGKGNPPEWVRRMAARRRKTLVVCRACHEGIHTGSPPRQPR